ncbi:RidA family protein [Natrononativus amylolyticus]|uniref:RidA family protein n=1 Tax=Natrononativus amylolyticus TaxID=2963434 RepID=UPI0020CC8626|nr:Rid family detoxifying hydrolase [Natrononativus amylolyticus]
MRPIEPTDGASTSYPYSSGIVEGPAVYVSGHIGTDPETGEVVDGGIEAETKQALANIAAVLEAADASLEDVVKTTVYLTDADDFEGFNAAYESQLSEPYPARTTVVSDLVVDAAIEIDVVATVS